jgi:hypothetical protein
MPTPSVLLGHRDLPDLGNALGHKVGELGGGEDAATDLRALLEVALHVEELEQRVAVE